MVKYGNEELILGILGKFMHTAAIFLARNGAVRGANCNGYVRVNGQKIKQ